MEKEFIPYDLAFRMKAIGYDEVCFGYYNHKKELHEVDPNSFTAKNSGVHYNVKIYNIFNKSVYKKLCTAPTWQSAFKWFREKKYHSGIIPYYDYYYFMIKDFNKGPEYNSRHFESDDLRELSFEEAELECLKKLIELIEK